MKRILVVDDENDLYSQMFSDLWNCEYDVEEIPKIIIPKFLRFFYRIHFSTKINNKINLPLKKIWNIFYGLGRYNYKSDIDYWVIILNGAIKKHYSMGYLRDFKNKHKNVKLCLIFFDSYDKNVYENGIQFELFDKVLSFDGEDCKSYGFSKIKQGQVFSMPKNLLRDNDKETDLFFVGMGMGRTDILHDIVMRIDNKCNYKVHICGVSKEEQLLKTNIQYNKSISYSDELQYAYNTNCILDVVKEGQSGITLRTCEAVLFGKKLLTNNKSIMDMSFYDEKNMFVFNDPSEINIDFIKSKVPVKYNVDDYYFSPVNIIKMIYDEE